ncbi:unnamed protein product [Colias eurytheme]|nr:unnamed protein product [Colias eurytheme]
MSFSNMSILSNFDHSLQTWKTFKSRIAQWFIANDIDAVKDPLGVKRRAFLLSALSDSTYKLASDLALPKELQEVPYEDILRLLDAHFTPKQVGFGERHKFYSAEQLPTESTQQWAARLRGLTAYCNFSNVEEVLRDRFIMGMLPGPEKEKLYVQDLAELTLARAVELVENLRSARAAAIAATPNTSDALFKIANKVPYNKNNSENKEKCSVCGYKNHKSSECRFASFICKRCHKKGHLRRMCKAVKCVNTDATGESDDDDIFSNKLGEFNRHKVSLHLKLDAKPLYFKARPMPFALRDKVDQEINRLLDLGILKPVSHSEYASPIVPVLKRDGSVRLCVDYSVSLNKQLVVDKYPLPTIKELFSKLHGGQQFSKLDLSMAYNQFVLDDQSQKYTCINTHRGLFVFTRLVFGLASAPAIFQRAMDELLSGIDGVLCLLDDVCITGRNRAEHLERLHTVLQRLQAAGLVLQREKCEYFKDEVNYLGYIINKDGLKKNPDKVKAILEAPIPANLNQLQSFLGLINYYRCFIPDASTILSPLYELLKKGIKWHWSDLENKAFIRIKEILASDQVLAHYNAEAKIILTVDASPSGLGAILSQIAGDGQERPVAFASRTLNSAEKHYSQIQKEATAIIFGVRRFHQYLYGRTSPFILRTDHKPLLSIFGPYKGIPEVSANRLQRYALFLSSYNYEIEYVKSKDNTADYLSRASLPLAPADGGKARGEADTCDRAAYIRFVFEGALPITMYKQPWDLENSNVSGTSSHSPTPSTSATREASVPRAEADERGDDRVTDSPVNSGSPQPATDGQQRSPPRPSWVTTTRGVRRPPETDVEDECFHDAEASQHQRDEVQPYQSAPNAREKRNRPKVDFKKYF